MGDAPPTRVRDGGFGMLTCHKKRPGVRVSNSPLHVYSLG